MTVYVGLTDHCAYNVTLADPIVNVDPVDRAVPDPSSALFQPVNEYPVRARFPVLLRTVTVAPCWYDVESVGTEPDDPLAGLL